MNWLKFISETARNTFIIITGVTCGIWLLNQGVVLFNKFMFKLMGYSNEDIKDFKEYWKDKD